MDRTAGLPRALKGPLLATAVSEAERTALCLLVDDAERRTRPLAIALGVDHLAFPEQRREVKRFKDRVLKRLARLAQRRP
jgi:hypothetical protein